MYHKHQPYSQWQHDNDRMSPGTHKSKIARAALGNEWWWCCSGVFTETLQTLPVCHSKQQEGEAKKKDSESICERVCRV